MEKYISKSALVAEIEKTYNFHEKRGNIHDASICDVLYGLLHRINTLEVKEVDLKKEMDKEWNKCEPIDEGMGLEIASIEHEQFDNIAKHFFELGLKAQKGKRYEIHYI